MRAVKAFLAVMMLAVLLAIGADAAVAGTIEVRPLYYKSAYEGDAVLFRGAPGEDNAVTVAQEGAVVVVTDRVPLVAGNGCEAQADGAVRCAVSTLRATSFRLRLGDGDDEARVEGATVATLRGEGGNDHLTGLPEGFTTYYGGSGNDRMVGGGGSDGFMASRHQDGSDTFIGGSTAPGATFPWSDSVSYVLRGEGIHADLDGDRDDGAPGERDRIGADIEVIDGSRGSDVLIGGPASDHLNGYDGRDLIRGGGGTDYLVGDSWVAADRPRAEDHILGGIGDDVLTGGAGGDRLTGGPGDDTIYAGPGPDRIRTRDDAADTVICGPGRDWLLLDALDFPRPDCERVSSG